MEASFKIEIPDYLIKSIAMVSHEQHQNYKDDFSAEFDKCESLHTRMETIAGRFIILAAQGKHLPPVQKCQIVHEVLQEHEKIKQPSHNYDEEKYMYLHNKVAQTTRQIH